jgi:dihydrofolate reductase
MISSHRIEGYAIVSADGMIADGNGVMPDAIRNAADQKFLQSELDRAAAVVNGRNSGEGGPRAALRKRLIVTRRVQSFSPDPAQSNTVLWNPEGATLAEALGQLDIGEGSIAIIGGPEVFGLFLPLYDAFHLTLAAHARIPGGTPLFPRVSSDLSPENVLAEYGLTPGSTQNIDRAAGITLTTWTRRAAT